MPGVVPKELAAMAEPHYQRALEMARKSNCNEAQFGAVIFSGNLKLAEGYNHLDGPFSEMRCDPDCPRRKLPQLRNGVGSEICPVTHAEEDCVNNFKALPRKHLMDGTEEQSYMVVGRLKNREPVLPKETAYVRCTLCARKLNETKIAGILFPVADGGVVGFVHFTREEFARMSVQNLAASWLDMFPVLKQMF